MLDTLQTNVITTIGLLATFGLAYIIDRNSSYTKSTPAPMELPSSEDIHTLDDAVPEIPEVLPEIPEEQPEPPAVEQPNTTLDIYTNVGPVPTPGHKCYSSDYRHQLWPSPRPVNFVKALVKGDHVRIEGRLTHGKAIEILARRAEMTPETFLKTDPLTYTKIFMPNQVNAAMLLGQSIQRLENTIRRYQYEEAWRNRA